MNVKECECSKPELDLFTVPPVNTTMESGTLVEHIPRSKPEDGPLEFEVKSNEKEYIDLARTFLYIKAKIVKNSGANLEATTKAGPVNLWFHSLFSQVDIQLGHQLVTPSVNTYPYKAYLETLLSYGSDAKESQLTAEMWYKDTPPMEHNDPYTDEADDKNEGFIARSQFSNTSKSVEMIGRLHSDIFHTGKYLLDGVDMHIKLIRSPAAFHLMADGTAYKTVIEDAVLYTRTVKINPSITTKINTQLDAGLRVKYPIRRSVVSTFTIGQNTLTVHKDNALMGQLPRRVVIGLVSNKAFHGAVTHNPFNFQHFNLSYLSLYMGGRQYPSKPLTPNYTNDQFLRSYLTLFEGTGMLNDNKGHGIGRGSYKDGFALYAFDLTPDMAEGPHIDPIKHGNIRLDLQFSAALAETVNVIIYAEYENLIQIDRARQVITDY